ncbi:MAG: hypothetical protein ACI4V1_02655, partial [Eubacteriales bacterium]
MKGVTTWNFRPYRPPMFDTGDIYICRIFPGVQSIGLSWLPLEEADVYTVYLRKRPAGDCAAEDWIKRETDRTTYLFSGLEDDTDYEFYVASRGKKSRVRLARTGFVPGDTVVNYLHPEDRAYSFSGNYLCSPSLVRHPDGYLLASMDVFQGGAPQDLTLLFRSDDDGATWNYVSELFPCFWGRMFLHNKRLYMLAVNTEYGDLLIGRSDDGGVTFGPPTVLLRGSSGFRQPGIHKNPQKVLRYGGRLWTTLEWGSWASGTHAAMCASVDENADLLDPSNWTFTPPVPYDPSWKGTAEGKSSGYLEGCMTVAPDGSLYNILRYQIERCKPSFGLAIVMRAFPEEPERALEFEKVISFPGNHSKFEITYDEKSGWYLSLVSYVDASHPTGRNLLTLIASRDLEHWIPVKDLFDYRDMPEQSVGFQY